MLRSLVKFVLIAEAFAVATYALGWWTVPLLALACGLIIHVDRKPVVYATLGATAGWLMLLLLDAARGPFGEVAARFGGVMGFPPAALVVTTLVFPGLLAWSASSIGAAVRRRMSGAPGVVLADA
jgi:hypothetical protein